MFGSSLEELKFQRHTFLRSRGGLASFSVPTLYRVAQELGISMDSLFEDPSKPKASVDFEEEQRAAARIEEEVVITNNGAQVITKFPAEKLFITNPY